MWWPARRAGRPAVGWVILVKRGGLPAGQGRLPAGWVPSCRARAPSCWVGPLLPGQGRPPASAGRASCLAGRLPAGWVPSCRARAPSCRVGPFLPGWAPSCLGGARLLLGGALLCWLGRSCAGRGAPHRVRRPCAGLGALLLRERPRGDPGRLPGQSLRRDRRGALQPFSRTRAILSGCIWLLTWADVGTAWLGFWLHGAVQCEAGARAKIHWHPKRCHVAEVAGSFLAASSVSYTEFPMVRSLFGDTPTQRGSTTSFPGVNTV